MRLLLSPRPLTTHSLLLYPRDRAPTRSTLQLQTPGQQISFIFIPPTHYTTYFICLQDSHTPGGEAVRQKHSRDRGRGQLAASNENCQLPQRRGRADVSDPVVRHPPERGTNPLLRTKRTHGQNGFARRLNRYIKKKKKKKN